MHGALAGRTASPQILRSAVDLGADWSSFLQGLLDALGPQMANLVAKAGRALQGAVSEDIIREALRRSTEQAVLDVIPIETYTAWLANGADGLPALATSLESAALESSLHVAHGMLSELGVDLSLPSLYVKANRWAQAYGADLVRGVSHSTIQGIRGVLDDALKAGFDPGTQYLDEVARRVKGMIGLDLNRGRSLVNYEAALREEGASEAMIAHRVKQRYGRLLYDRGKTISRTELWNAGHEGQASAWGQALAEGQLDREYKRQWVRSVRNPCPICISLHLQIRGMHEAFVAPANGKSYMRPTVHPKCYCHLRLVRAA